MGYDDMMVLVAFTMWGLGTITVGIMGVMGMLNVDDFNATRWREVHKNPQYHIFIMTILAWLMIFVIRITG